MRAVLAGLVGLGAAALLSSAALTVASCSCPPGYQPRLIPPGTYQLSLRVDGGQKETDGRLVIDASMARETFTRDGVPYEIVYQVIGAR